MTKVLLSRLSSLFLFLLPLLPTSVFLCLVFVGSLSTRVELSLYQQLSSTHTLISLLSLFTSNIHHQKGEELELGGPTPSFKKKKNFLLSREFECEERRKNDRKAEIERRMLQENF